jgi:hypothetical protein
MASFVIDLGRFEYARILGGTRPFYSPRKNFMDQSNSSKHGSRPSAMTRGDRNMRPGPLEPQRAGLLTRFSIKRRDILLVDADWSITKRQLRERVSGE